MLDVRLIEMMPIGLGKDFKPVRSADVLACLTAEFGEPVESVKRHGSGPAEYWNFPGFRGSVGFISARAPFGGWDAKALPVLRRRTEPKAVAAGQHFR